MKILHHTTDFLPPSQTFVLDIINSVSSHVTNDLIVTHNLTTTNKNIHIEDISIGLKNKYLKKASNLSHQLLGLAHNTNYIKSKKILKEFKPDIIHCHFGTAGYFNYHIQKHSKTDIPVVVALHGFDVFCDSNMYPGYAETIKKLSNKNCFFSTPTNYLKEIACKEFKIESDKVFVVPNGYNNNIFAFKKSKKPDISNKINIINVSRFIDWKGQSYLIKAVNILLKQDYDIQLNLVGDGYELNNCKELVNRLNITDHVIFHGLQSPTEISQLMANNHLYVQPSITSSLGNSETFGVSILEAIASGLPVIITDSGGMKEVFHKPGYIISKVVKEKSEVELAEAIKNYILEWNTLNWEKLKDERKLIIDRNNTKNASKYYLEIYNELLL